MTVIYRKLDATYSRTISVRMPDPAWQAIEACREQFIQRDQVPYTFGEVLVFLLQTYLYEHQQIGSPPAFQGRGARRLTRQKLEKENAALRQELADLKRKQQENQ